MAGEIQPSDCAVCGMPCNPDIAKLAYVRFRQYLCTKHYDQRKSAQGLPGGGKTQSLVQAAAGLDTTAMIGRKTHQALQDLQDAFTSGHIIIDEDLKVTPEEIAARMAPLSSMKITDPPLTNLPPRDVIDMRAPSLLADAARKFENGEITEDDYVTLLQELMVDDPQQKVERVELFTTLRLFLEGLSANYYFPDNVRNQAAFLLNRLPKAGV